MGSEVLRSLLLDLSRGVPQKSLAAQILARPCSPGYRADRQAWATGLPESGPSWMGGVDGKGLISYPSSREGKRERRKNKQEKMQRGER